MPYRISSAETHHSKKFHVTCSWTAQNQNVSLACEFVTKSHWWVFFIGNQEKIQTNSSVHNINTRNKHNLHRPVANLSCFQKGASYSGIRIFNSLPRSITNLKNEKTQFKVALKMFLNAHSFYSVDEFFKCTEDMYYWLYDCVNVPYTNIFIVCMFMTCSTSYCLVTLKDLWNVYRVFHNLRTLLQEVISNIHKRDRDTCPRRDSNPQSQQASYQRRYTLDRTAIGTSNS